MPLKEGPLPKHYQLTEILREQIRSGVLRPGDQLPSEPMLCQQYQVSRGTVRKAFSTLAAEGYVYSRQGRGTFVSEPKPLPISFTLSRFDEEMLRQRRRPSTRLLALETTSAPFEIARRLEVKLGEPVVRIVRLRLADEQPVIYETRYLAQAICPALVNEDLATQSIHTLLVEKYRIPLVRSVHIIEARILPPEEARLLCVDPGTPAFFVDRLTYTSDQTGQHPAVLYQAFYRGDEYHFRAEFGMPPL